MNDNERAYVDALHAELAYVKAQPGDNDARIADIEAEIGRVEPERAVVEAPENTAAPASKAAKKQTAPKG